MPVTYITCPKKKSLPKVNIKVCEACTKRYRCRSFQLFKHPPLFLAEDLRGLAVPNFSAYNKHRDS